MLTSAFSHQSFIHLLFNTMVLYDFGTSIHYQLGLNTPLFLAFYASAGTLSSLGSRLVSLLYKTASVSRGSVGASGALYALVAMNAYLHPDWKVSLIILPGVDFSMGQLVPCLLLLDVVGIFRRWQMFDHAAHVAGAAAGLGFITYGREYWNILQGKLDQEHFKRRKGE
ncbi:Rho- GTP-binding protein RhoN [Nowakowskiella sp. JEL0407]|nr:Rho- GTP-binding protein RhoN [Nowakowskiella sp. JEL0407]